MSFNTTGDAGHGGKDCGANYPPHVERDMNLVVSKAYVDYLTKNYQDVNAVQTRKTNTEDYPLDKRLNDANTRGCDLYLAFHFDAGKGNRGSVIVPLDGSGNKFANYLKERALVELKQPYSIVTKESTKTKGSDYFGVNRQIKGLGIILEGCFLDNPDDVKDYDTTVELVALGEFYAKCVADFYKLKPKVLTSTKQSATLKAINTLVDAGIIKSPSFWTGAEKNKQPISWAVMESLLQNMDAYIKKGK